MELAGLEPATSWVRYITQGVCQTRSGMKTTLIYADYAPSAHEAKWINQAFSPSKVPIGGTVEPAIVGGSDG